ncbi:MAG: asparaginase domain-containing protein [Elusimicrobiota bacterium]|jgi:L-asparaginase
MRLRVIVTGGTFDKEYNELDGSLFFRTSHLGEMLKLGRCRIPVKVQTLLMIDSLEMTARHRRKVLDAVQKCPEKRIVVTHGTDTMAETAAVLGKSVQGKTVVLTGAMVPYKFGSSDGMFNLGSALSFAQSLPAGVYVAMNGRFFPWDDVRKNRKKGEFESIR